MKKRVKIIGAILIVVFLIIYGVVVALTPMSVETKTMVMGESELSFIEAGVVVNSGERIIYPMAAGEVSHIQVVEGDMVKDGDILASLDKSAIDLQVRQMETTVDGIKAQISSAEIEYANGIDTLKANRSNLIGQLKQLNAEAGSSTSRDLETLLVEQSKSIYERGVEDLEKQKELFALGYISEATFKDFESLVDSYEANYNSNKIAANAGTVSYSGMKDALNAQISSINATLERDTLTPMLAYYQALLEGALASMEGMKVQAAYYDITASIDGVVNEIMIENVNMVTGMTPAFIVQGQGDNKIEVKVNTRDIDAIHTGDQVKLILDRRTGDIEVGGMISHVSTSATVEISPLGLEERKVQVIVQPDEQDQFAAGYDVDVKFILFSESDQLVAPNSALYKVDGIDMLMVIREGKATEVEVDLGFELTGETIIEGGINQGDVVITDLDAKGLQVGKRVKSSNE